MNHLSVRLGEVAVGDLRRRSGDAWEFRFRPVVERANGEDIDGDEELTNPPVEPPKVPTRLKFSLAGVQLKFSVLREGTRLNLPASGQGGRWIVKCPDPLHPGLPANEVSILRWARSSGIEVPDHELVPMAELQGVPDEITFSETEGLAVRRFDRTPTSRIHQEDFAQVLGLFPSDRYDVYNYETIGNVVRAAVGPDAFVEFARRLAFMVLSGNGDAHHKNWSLLYPDGIHASLAPSYDLVFTRAYNPNDDLALNFGGSKKFSDVTIHTFRRLARKGGGDEERLADAVSEAAAAIRQAWKEINADVPLGPEAKTRLSRHLDSVRF